MKKWINKKTLAGVAVIAVGAVTVASASKMETLFEPKNYKWFQNADKSQQYDYVSGDGTETDLADRDQNSNKNSGKNQQEVQLENTKRTTLEDNTDQSRFNVLGIADNTGNPDGTANGIAFADGNNADGIGTITDGTGIGIGDNTGTDSNGTTSGDNNGTGTSDTNGTDNGKNNGNSGTDGDKKDDTPDPEPVSWEDTQLKPKDLVETEYGLLTGLSATITRDYYCRGDVFQASDATVTATFRKDGKSQTRELSYGGSDGYSVSLSTIGSGRQTAIFSYKGMTARATYQILASPVTVAFQAYFENAYYSSKFPGTPLLNMLESNGDNETAQFLSDLNGRPYTTPSSGNVIDLTDFHSRMIAYLGDEQIKSLFQNSTGEGFAYTTYLQEENGYLTTMLSGFIWMSNKQVMDSQSYVYYPASDWGTLSKNVIDLVTTVPEGYKIRRVVHDQGDWLNYGGDQVMEQYTGTDAALSVPMGVTAINFTEPAASVTTLELPNSVQSIDVSSIAENLPNLTAYQYTDESQASIGKYKIEDGILYSQDGTTLISVPAGKENVVIPETVTTLAPNCLKGVKADTVQFAGTTIPTVIGSTGYEGTIVVPASKYDLVCKKYMFAFGTECTNIDFRDTTGSKIPYTYQTDGPFLTFRDADDMLAAIPFYSTGKYQISSNVTTIGTGVFVDCMKLTDLEIGGSVESLAAGSLQMPYGISDIILTKGGILISPYAFGNPAKGATVPDINIYVNEEDYDAYLSAWSAALDPVYGEGTAERLLKKNTGSIFYENGAKYRAATKNGKTEYKLLKVYEDNLTAFQVKEGTTEIAQGALLGCDKLELLYLPESLQSAGAGVFSESSSLETIVTEGSRSVVEAAGETDAEILAAGETFTEFSYEDGIVYGKNQGEGETLISVPSDYMEVVQVREDTTALYKNALKNCNNLKGFFLKDETKLEEIGESCFENCTRFTYMDLKDCINLKTIGKYAFRNCSNITWVSLPESVTVLPEGALYGCDSLKTMNTEYLTRIEAEAFYDCESIENLTESTALTYVGDRAFYNCSRLQTVVLGENVEFVGEECFGNCVALTDIELKGTIPGISRYCFYGCRALINVTFSEQQKEALKLIGVEAFAQCEQLKDMDLREFTQLKQMGERTFSGCKELISVKLPDSLVAVPDYCFENCGYLSILQLNGESVTEPGTYIFGDELPVYVHLRVPEEYLEDYRDVYEQPLDDSYGKGTTDTILEKNDDTTEVIKGLLYENTPEGRVLKKAYTNISGEYELLPDTIRIEDEAFKDCTGLTLLIMPTNSTISIGDNCFEGCTGLTEVRLRGNITDWGTDTFKGCTALKQVYLGYDGTTINRIGTRAFKGCTGLATTSAVQIAGKVFTWGEECFADCENMPAIGMQDTTRNNTQVIEDRAFAGCKKLSAFLTSKFTSLTTIGDYAFTDCDTLSAPSVPANVKTIGEGCFMDCDNVKYVSFYGGVEEYPKYCFKNCPKLIKTGGTAAAFAGLKRIGEGAYEGCVSLNSSKDKTINWGLDKYTNLESVGANAFNGCTTLPYAELSATVTEIGDGAFNGCTSLARLNFASQTPPSIGSFSLNGLPETFQILVPDSQEDGDSVYLAYQTALNHVLDPLEVRRVLDSESDGAKDRQNTETVDTGTDTPDDTENTDDNSTDNADRETESTETDTEQ